MIRWQRALPLGLVFVSGALYGCKSDAHDAAWKAVLSRDGGVESGDSRAGDTATEASDDSTTTTERSEDGTATTDLTDETGVTGNADSSEDLAQTSVSTPSDVDSSATSDVVDATGTPNDSTDSAEDTASSTEGATDTSGDDATVDPSAPGDSCAGQDYLLCESFEQTALADVPDGWQRLGEAVAVSEEHAHGGSRSLKLGQVAQGERRIAHDASALTGTHWGRLYYRVEAAPDTFVHSTLLALDGVGPQGGASEYRALGTVKHDVATEDVGGLHNWIFHVQRDPTSDGCGDSCDGEACVCEYGTETSYDWQFDGEWHCVEYFIDSATQSYRFFFDGAEELSFSGSFEDWQGLTYEADLPTTYETVKVGWNNYSEAPPGFEAYIDDVAFDDERIGCLE